LLRTSDFSVARSSPGTSKTDRRQHLVEAVGDGVAQSSVIFGPRTYCSPGTSDAVFEAHALHKVRTARDWPASWLFAASCCDISSVSRPLTGSPVAFSSTGHAALDEDARGARLGLCHHRRAAAAWCHRWPRVRCRC
jgi:hypothetical protein